MSTSTYTGTLEIDHERGVIYFHLADEADMQKLGVTTALRICRLPRPIPHDRPLDITHLHDIHGAD
jgi:hypothetical protein